MVNTDSTPTPQKVRAMLRKVGLKNAKRHTTAIRGYYHWEAGFQVEDFGRYGLRVTYQQPPRLVGHRESSEEADRIKNDRIARMVTILSQSYKVERVDFRGIETPTGDCLIVTGKEI